jgi:hypothetical protein
LIAATSIFIIIASNARFASPPPAAGASISTRGVICQEMPHLSLHQLHALCWRCRCCHVGRRLNEPSRIREHTSGRTHHRGFELART